MDMIQSLAITLVSAPLKLHLHAGGDGPEAVTAVPNGAGAEPTRVSPEGRNGPDVPLQGRGGVQVLVNQSHVAVHGSKVCRRF